MSWSYFREQRSGVWGRLRRVLRASAGRGEGVFGVEVSVTGAEGDYQYAFNAAGRTPAEAAERARLIIRERFAEGIEDRAAAAQKGRR